MSWREGTKRLTIHFCSGTKRHDVDTKRPGTKRPGYETSCTQIEKLCFFQLCVSVKGDIYYHTSYFLTLRCIITLVKGVSTWYCNFNKYKYNFRYSNTAHIPTVKTTWYVIDIMLQKLGMSCQTTIGKKHFPINLRV